MVAPPKGIRLGHPRDESTNQIIYEIPKFYYY